MNTRQFLTEFKLDVLRKAWQEATKLGCKEGMPRSKTFDHSDTTVTNVTTDIFSIGHSTFFRSASCTVKQNCCCAGGINWTGKTSVSCDLSFGIRDSFKDPLDSGIETGGTPYRINGIGAIPFQILSARIRSIAQAQTKMLHKYYLGAF